MYNYAIIATDVLSIFICGIILVAIMYGKRSIDQRNKALTIFVSFHIIMCLTEIITKICLEKHAPDIVIKGLSNWIMMGSLFSITLFLQYLFFVGSAKGLGKEKVLTGVVKCSLIFTIIAILICISGNAYSVSDSVISYKAGYYICVGMIFVLYVFMFMAMTIKRKKIGIRDYLIFVAYVYIPLGLSLVNIAVSPENNFAFAGVTITIVMIFSVYQTKLFSSNERENMRYFKSMAAVYTSMYLIDFENNYFKELSATDAIHKYVYEHKDLDIQEIIWATMRSRTCEDSWDNIIAFTDFSTLEARMNGKNMIDIELLSVDNEWFRFSFLRVHEDDNSFKKVIYTSQNIDESKRKERELILLSNTDELTQLYNRHAYETDVAEIDKNGVKDDLCYIAIDLNGLKHANDSKGHDAGDELLQGMANCLSRAMHKYGKVYRVGGDEFAVILNGSETEIKNVLSELESLRLKWSGKYNNSLSFSKGVVRANEMDSCTMEMLEKEADVRMYKEKDVYYETSGMVRRR